MKTLIAYYSRKGQNYVDGNIVDLQIGNTKIAAEMIRKLISGDTFQIDTVKVYPAGYHETTAVAKQELHNNARPELTSHVPNIRKYEVVILGYPNWWGTMPMAVFSFLERHDLAGKTILPFCTHEGSGLGHSVNDIMKLCAGATVLRGLAIRGGSVQRAESEIVSWLKTAGLIE